MKKFLFIFVLILICFIVLATPINDLIKPGPMEILPDPIFLVHEVQSLARLETASVDVEKILRVEKDNTRLWGVFGERLVFVYYGKIIAGVDLSQIQESDIQIVDSDTIKIHLPEAEIFSILLDNNKSYVASREKGILAKTDPQLETRTRQHAQQELGKAAAKLEILETANQNAKTFISNFIQQLGVKNIEFR